MENYKTKVDVKLVRSNEEEGSRELIASLAFARQNIFDNDLTAIVILKSRLQLNKPIYVGISTLELSKH